MTGLRCSRCGKPICPECAVRTPVGLRCPECAGVRNLPTIKTPANDLVRSVGGGIAVALLVAVLWRFFPSWGFYLSLAMGFGVVEVIAKYTRNKRGRDLQVIAMLVITGGFVLSRVLLAQRFGVTAADLNALNGTVFNESVIEAYGFPQSVGFLLRIQAVPDLVYMALAYVIAFIRFR
jgi:DNA-directed RNA polymerase subunit RPC12/RpoP